MKPNMIYRLALNAISATVLLGVVSWFAILAFLLFAAQHGRELIASKEKINSNILADIELGLVFDEPNSIGVAAPLGWQPGRQSCAEISKQYTSLKLTATSDGTSYINASFADIALLNLVDVMGIFIACDKNDLMRSISISFYKNRHETERMELVAKKLTQRYQIQQEIKPEPDNPDASDVFGRWQAKNAEIEINYHVMDRLFYLHYSSFDQVVN